MKNINDLEIGNLLTINSNCSSIFTLYTRNRSDQNRGIKNNTFVQGETLVFLKSKLSFIDRELSNDSLYQLEVIKPPTTERYHLIIWKSTFDREIVII